MAIVLQGRKVISFVGDVTNPAAITLNTLWSQGAGGTNYTPVQGDVVYVAYAIGGNLNIDVAMVTSGYTEVTDLYANGTSYDANLAVFRKVMGSTPDTSVQVGPTTSAQFAGAVVVEVWSGIDPTNPEDVTPTTATGTGTGRPSPPPAITPSTTGAMVSVFGAGAAQSGANFVQSGSELSNFVSATGADTVDVTIGAGHFVWTSGTYSPVNWIAGSAIASNSWAAVSIAHRPKSTNTNMTADPGSYSVTGTAAGLLRGLWLIAADHSYVLTGTDVTLTEASGLTHYSMVAAQPSPLYPGPELVPDMSFDDAGQWSAQTGWAVSGGKAVATATTGTILTTADLGVVDRTYAYEFQISNFVSGTVRARFGANSGLNKGANGVFTGNIVSTFTASPAGLDGVTAFTGDIDYISFKELTGYGVTGTDVSLSRINSYSVTADPGSYSLTGTVTGLFRGPLVVAAPGTYALTGTVTSLYRNRLVTAVPGTYSLTGTATGLRESAIVMDAAPGSYSLTGTAATFVLDTSAYFIIADPGSYSTTGTVASLLRGYPVTSVPGVYTLNGTAVGLLRGPLITAVPGSYALTGTVVNFLKGRSVVADPGVYTVSGTDVTFATGKNMPTTPETYTYTGTAVGLRESTIIMDAAAGSYLLSGTVVNFLYTQVIDIEEGFYDLDGESVTLIDSGAPPSGGGAHVKVATFFYRV